MDDDAQAHAAELPLPNFDQLRVPDLQHRIRTLDREGIDQLLAHERDHAHRPQVIQLLLRRAEELEHGATPSGGDPATASVPEPAPGPARQKTTTPQTSGPVINPPSHGVPTNPAQPRSTG